MQGRCPAGLPRCFGKLGGEGSCRGVSLGLRAEVEAAGFANSLSAGHTDSVFQGKHLGMGVCLCQLLHILQVTPRDQPDSEGWSGELVGGGRGRGWWCQKASSEYLPLGT